MKRFKVTLSLFLIMTLVLTSGCFVFHPKKVSASDPINFRAMWVASVYNLDYPSKVTADAATLKEQAITVLDQCKKMGMNAVILQVRPSSDALYSSSIYPWSRFLTGTCGAAPNDDFDPLSFWVSEAHKRGLQLHAWINPYRITTAKDSEFEGLPANHPAKQHPEWVVKYSNGNYYFNPGIPAVREMIVKGAEEIARNYDVDGIHMDDYFYPGADFDDAATYQTYGASYSNIGDFRRDSVNQLVKTMHDRLHAIRSDISFGVSPFGIWANKSSMAEGSNTKGNQSYSSHFADSKKWVKEGFVDYICPQIYWYIGHPSADYATLVQWWSDVVQGTSVKLYIGMADYQAGNKDEKSPWHGISAIQKETELNRKTASVSGEVHYSYHSILANSELYTYYQNLYKNAPVTDENTDTPSVPSTDEDNNTSNGSTPDLAPTEEPSKPTIHIKWHLNQTSHSAYMQGDGDTFRPDDRLTRAEAAMIFARLMANENNEPIFKTDTAYECTFKDVDPNAWYSGAVGFMQQFGILSGYDDGTFRPNYQVTRAEFATMAYLASQATEKSAAQFSDVDTQHWANGYIGYAKEKGWVSGYEDGTFKPNALVTRAEVAKMVNSILGRVPDPSYIQSSIKEKFSDISPKHWAYYEIMEAAIGHSYHKNNNREIWEDVL